MKRFFCVAVLLALCVIASASPSNEKNEIFTPAVTVQATSMDIGTMWVQGRLEVHFEMTPKIDETFLLVRFGEQEIVSSSVDNGRWPAMTFSVLSIEDVNELEVEVWSGDLKIGSTLEYKTTVKLQRHANGEAKLLLTSTENNSISKRIQKWAGAKPELKARYSYTPNKNFKNPAKPISVSPSFFTAARGYRTSHSVAMQKLKVKHAKEITDLCYLLVPGFGTTPFPGYFDGNRDVLKGLGATCVKQSEISTFGSLENNAKKISSEVLALSNQHKKKVVVIGHSKGALDIAGLVLKHKTTLSHVDGVILAQGPIYGTAGVKVMDEISPLLKKGAGSLLNIVGDRSSLVDMDVRTTKRFMASAPWPKNLYTLCIGSYADYHAHRGGKKHMAVMKPMTSLMLKYTGFRTDGLIPRISTVVPGAYFIRSKDMDHGSFSMDAIVQRKVSNIYKLEDPLMSTQYKSAEVMFGTLSVYFENRKSFKSK